jgi:phage baseplate assembly protein W
MVSLADRKTLEQKKVEIHSDFLTSFDKNPFTGYLGRVTNEESVRQSLKNLFLTNQGERFYNTLKGSNIRDSLFELVDINDIEILKQQMRETAQVWEPRAILQDIEINENNTVDTNNLEIKVIFSVINIIDQTFELNLIIERVR